jgi:hypothetical protein
MSTGRGLGRAADRPAHEAPTVRRRVVDVIEDGGEVVAHLVRPGEPPMELDGEETLGLLSGIPARGDESVEDDGRSIDDEHRR